MRIFFVIVISILLVLSGSPLKGLSQENYAVRKVNFSGNETLEKSFLLDKMALKEVSFLEELLSQREPFLYSEELVKLDIERLTRIYQTEGFLWAECKLQSAEVNDKKATVELTIKIEEGPPVITRQISLEINEEVEGVDTDSLKNELHREMNLKKGERFRDQALTNDLEIIEDAFKSCGYAFAEVRYELDLDTGQKTTSVIFSVSPGPLTFFGETSISGNDQVSETFIRKQLKFSTGEVYDKSQLTKTRQNLYRLDRFRIVSVLPETEAKDQENRIPVTVYIEEAPRLSARYGAGYGTEDKFRTFLDLNYRGFAGAARRLNLYLKHSALEPYSARLRWIQPQFLGLNSSISLDPFIIRKSEPGFETRTYGLNVPFAYQFNPRLNSKITYYFEDVEQWLEPGDTLASENRRGKLPYKKSGLLLNSVFDNSWPAFSPQRGINLTTGLKINGTVFGGRYDYLRFWSDFRIYRETGNVILALRAMGGVIHGFNTEQFIPVEDRFYSGGSNSIRGWARSDLGPKRESGTPRGGRSIFEGNLEARIPLFWKLSLATFFEGGNVWQDSWSWNFLDLGYASGLGVRFETPIGPVRFDVGFPLWNEKTTPQYFISVGQAF